MKRKKNSFFLDTKIFVCSRICGEKKSQTISIIARQNIHKNIFFISRIAFFIFSLMRIFHRHLSSFLHDCVCRILKSQHQKNSHSPFPEYVISSIAERKRERERTKKIFFFLHYPNFLKQGWREHFRGFFK
jgi:hypothetical protein